MKGNESDLSEKYKESVGKLLLVILNKVKDLLNSALGPGDALRSSAGQGVGG